MLIPYRRRLIKKWLLLSIPIFLLLILSLTFTFDSSSSPSITTESSPKEVVKTFYEYERAGKYGLSWELLHSQLKEKFVKNDYIEKRDRFLMQDFGAETFTFTTGEPRVITSWRMAPSSPLLAEVIQIPVSMIYESIFGNFVIKQDVFLAKEDDQYKILWLYSDDHYD